VQSLPLADFPRALCSLCQFLEASEINSGSFLSGQLYCLKLCLFCQLLVQTIPVFLLSSLYFFSLHLLFFFFQLMSVYAHSQVRVHILNEHASLLTCTLVHHVFTIS